MAFKKLSGDTEFVFFQVLFNLSQTCSCAPYQRGWNRKTVGSGICRVLYTGTIAVCNGVQSKEHRDSLYRAVQGVNGGIAEHLGSWGALRRGESPNDEQGRIR